MVLSRKALERFKSRQLRNLEEYKNLPLEVLDAKLKDAKASWVTEPMHHQKVGLLTGLENNALYLLFDPGLGKGHPAGTGILTLDGFVPVELVSVGTKVIGPDGQWVEVRAKYARGPQKVFRITFSDGFSVLCDDEHLWLVITNDSDVDVKSTGQIIEAGVIGKDGRPSFSIPITEPIDFDEKDLPLDPYLLGVLLGSGSLNQITPVYVTNNPKLVEEVKTRVPPQSLHAEHKVPEGQIKSFSLKQRGPGTVADTLKSIGLFPIKGKDKFIPSEYLFSSIEQRTALLRGLMDCDGEVVYDLAGEGLPFACKSEQLAKDVAFLVQSLGGTAELGPMVRKKDPVGCFIRLPEGLNPFLLDAEKYHASERNLPRRDIVSVEYVGTQPTFCLSVDDDLYLTEHCIVTHNTKVALDLLQSRRDNIRRCLVLVPGVANIGGWLDEIKLHAPDFSAIGFYDMTKKQKAEAVSGPHNIMVMTYMGWLALLGVTKRKGKRNIDLEWMESVESLFQMVVWDEVDACKSRSSLSFKAAERLIRKVPYRYALSGTPFDKNPIDLWSQFYLLDYGHAMGENISLFRNAFCTAKYNPFSGGYDYTFDRRKTKQLSDRIKNTALLYSEKECLDLPKTVGGLLSPNFMVLSAPFPKENQTFYQQIKEELKLAGQNRAEVKNVYIRMRQLTAGFIPIVEEGVRRDIMFSKNPKMEMLFDLLKTLPAEKILVFNEFKTSGRMICEALTANGITNCRLYSGTPDKVGVINKFKSDPSIRVLVGSRSVVYGLNLQLASHLIVYESPDSTRHRQQLERRIRRLGQSKVTYIYDLAIVKSVDISILKALRSGKDLIDELISSDAPYSLVD